MCGIAAIYNYKLLSKVSRNELYEINSAMRKRGPDGEGIWISEDEYIGLGHRRLSILDESDKGSQPMQSKSGRYLITFNGEIYNYPFLRKELENTGFILNSNSDTETLIELFEIKGLRLFSELRGMFALAIWDNRNKELILARDPYGIKPLYYSDDGESIRVASQVKALNKSKLISKKIDSGALVSFYLSGSIPEPLTIYESIRSISPGTYLKISESGELVAKKFFDVSQILVRFPNQKKINEEESDEIIESAIIETINKHLLSDVKLGLFLSGGIDSSIIASVLYNLKQSETLTLRFKEYLNQSSDEFVNAEKIAKSYNLDYSEELIEEYQISESLGQFLNDMDQPSIDGLNTWFISKAASKKGWKVALSGVGLDEILGGYSSFDDIEKWMRNFAFISRRKKLSNLFYKTTNYLPLNKTKISPKLPGLFKYTFSTASTYFLKRCLFLPEELPYILSKEIIEEGTEKLDLIEHYSKHINAYDFKNEDCKISSLESCFYMKNQLLRDIDWAGMAHSLEIRTPFVDINFLQKVQKFLSNKEKLNKKNLLYNFLKTRVPSDIVKKKKTGFTVPLNNWLESNKDISIWNENKLLRNPNCNWARKWAYSLMKISNF